MAQCTNCSSDIESEKYFEPYVLIVLTTGVFCSGLNALVFVIFLMNKKLRQNPYHFLVLLLSFCDLLVGLGFVVFSVRKLGNRLTHSRLLCIVQTVLFTNGILLSLFQTFLISLQRYLVICKTSWSNLLFQHNRKYIVCILNWMVISIFTVGLISPPKEDIMGECNIDYVYKENHVVMEVFVRSTIVFLVMTVVLYCVTIRHVVRMNRKIVPKGRDTTPHQLASNSQLHCQTSNQNTAVIQSTDLARENGNQPCSAALPPLDAIQSHKNSVSSQATEHGQITTLRKKKIMNTFVLVGILMSFLIFLSGPLIVSLVIPYVPPLYLAVASGLCCLNSVVNPFIYCWKIHDLREALKTFLRKVFCCS